MSDLDPLVSALRQADSLPFLFVGSGVSRRYLGHDDWQGLLEWAADLTGKPYPYYAGQAEDNLPRAASLIAKAFYEVWWSAEEFESSRSEWGESCKNLSSPLKVEVAKRLSDMTLLQDATLQKELKLLSSCQVDGIITTNYDGLLETIFPTYRVFVGQEDLLLGRSYQLAEIYKIHGSVSEPDSLVLTEEDYRKFDGDSAYLVAKLMSVFVEHPIVFIGYALADRNIRVILSSLLRCLSTEKIEEFKSRFIWIDYDPAVVEPNVNTHVIDVGDGRLLPVLRMQTSSFLPLFDALNGLERVLPVGLLRRVEESVVKIIHSADPTRQIRVSDLRSLDSFDDADIVVGIGRELSTAPAVKGYLGYRRHDLIVDTLTGNEPLDPAEVVRTTLPEILKIKTWVPVHKYVAASGLDPEEIPAKVKRAMVRKPKTNYTVAPGDENLELEQLVSLYGLNKALDLVCGFDPSSVDVGELQAVLVAHIDELSSKDANLGTAFGKATCLFDLLRYGSSGSELQKEPDPKGPPDNKHIRAWAKEGGLEISEKGPIPKDIRALFERSHS